jgi:hypothetical protein
MIPLSWLRVHPVAPSTSLMFTQRSTPPLRNLPATNNQKVALKVLTVLQARVPQRDGRILGLALLTHTSPWLSHGAQLL